MHGVITARVAAAEAGEIAAALGGRPGVLGLEELPGDGASAFAVPAGFRVLEFGTPQADRFRAWLEAGEFQTGAAVVLKVYVEVPSAAALTAWLAETQRELGQGLEVIGQEILEPCDYTAASRDRARGRAVGATWWVGPPWETPPPGRRALVIDPGMAFGTGDHPTTQFCLAALERLPSPPRAILDLGTGSGILAIAAAKQFPAATLWLTELDPQCATNTARNFALNQLAAQPRREFWGAAAALERLPTDGPRFELVLSNLYLDVLLTVIEPVADRLAARGRWVVSGLFDGAQCAEFVERAGRRLRVTRREVLPDESAPAAWVGLELEPREQHATADDEQRQRDQL